MQIYMMRHAQSQSNAQKTVTGQSESPLTAVGMHQAELAGQNLKDKKIDLIVCSPLKRAKQTAKIVAKQIGYQNQIIIDDDLIERSIGELEGKSYAQSPRLNGNFPETELIKGVESLNHLHSRVSHSLRKLLPLSKTQNILIVCHMNIGRMLWVIAKGLPAKELYNQPRLENAKVYKLL